jgi:WD40 repeat protein
LVTIRVEECSLDGLPTGLAHLDLAGIGDPRAATTVLLNRFREVLSRRPASGGGPGVLDRRALASGLVPQPAPAADARLPTAQPARRVPVAEPIYPPDAPAKRRDGVSLLHVAGPRFGRGLADPDEPVTAGDLRDRVQANVHRLIDSGVPAPDLLVVSGDLTESARPRQLEEAWSFLTGLRVVLGLEAHRMIIVPGGRDVSRAACESYFNACEARDTTPLEPFYPKLELYAELFADLYQGLDQPLFDSAQPWTLFAVPELQVALAALNSTMAMTHRPRDNYGRIGHAQATWFAERLRPFEESGWLRIGLVRHDPLPGSRGAEDAATLRDADTLEGLLGNRLNLLLHGPGPGGTSIEFLGSRLPVVPADRPGREEIIQLTADGLRRFSAYQGRIGEPTERLEREWRGAASTFTPAAPESSTEPDEDGVLPAIEAAQDPSSLLLARIVDVCEARYPGARIRRVGSAPPQLLVTRQEDGFTRQNRLGAHVGELTAEVVDEFLRHDRTDGAELVYQGPPPAEALRQRASRRQVRLRSFTEFQGLLDLAGYVSAQTLRLRADQSYPPELYVPQRYRDLGHGDQSIRDDLAQELMNLVLADQGRFVLVLGDFGRGKSFVLHEVARRIAETTHQLIPILINLAALDRSHSVDGLVAAHLAQHGEDLIDLRAFRYMLDEGRIVLLFDGFDELVTRISYDRAADHLEKLLRAAEGKAKIIVASRTQHFKSHAQVFTALGERVGLLPQRRILNVEEFTAAQIRAYLVNRYAGDEHRADARFQLLTGIGDLLGLAQNPRMLSFIADLDEERIRAAVQSRHTISPAGLYQEILQTWMSHENRRASGGGASAVPGVDTEAMWEAVTALAVRLWETGETHVQPAQLAEVVDTLAGLASTRLSAQERLHAVGSGSLLVRTEEGLFGFIHASVMEWLIARAIAEEFAAGVAAPAQLAGRPLTQLTVDFLCDLAETRACQSWAEAVLADADADQVARTNALKVRTRLDTPATADLRGASLRGEDLSYRELSDVDLTGADLTEASLIGANLSGADLRDARLVGARLDHARLVGADLSGADLTRARLSRADLTGATVAGSRWTRAAVIDARGVPDVPELRAAAVAPGSPVEVELAPAAIGVRHGYHAETGRLLQVLAYSPDGGTLAIGSEHGGVLVCDTATGRPVRSLQGHRGHVFAVSYGDGVLVTGSNDGTARLWDPATGRPLHVLDGHQDWPWPVVLGPSGDVLATGDSRGVLRLWDLASGSLRHQLPSQGGHIVSMAFHGQLLATADQGGDVRLWDTATGAAAAEFPVAADAVSQVSFSPDGELLVTCGSDGAIRGWDRSGRQVYELAGHAGGVHAMDLHPSEPLLASGDAEGGVRLWDTSTGQLRQSLPGHAAALYCIAFSPSGDTIASGDSAGAVQVWETRTGRPLHTLSGHTGSVWPFAFRPDGAQLAISDDQFSTRLWDPLTGDCRHTISGHGRRVAEVRFSADGALLATSGNDGAVRLWNPTTGRQLRRLVGSAPGLINLESALFSPAGPLLAMASNDGRLNLLNIENIHSDRYERHLNIESAPIWAVAFSPTGEELATGNDDDTVRIWHRATGRLVHTLAEHSGRVRSIAYSADGSVIATGCDDSMVRLWDAASGTLLRTLRGHTDRVYAVAFGRGLLASASWDTTARVWNTQTGRAVHVLTRHTGRLWTVAFDPSGGLLATAGDDLVIRLWEPRSGDHLQTLTGHSHSVLSVTFNPSGDLLASAGHDGTARLWSVSNGQAAKHLTLVGLPRGWAALCPDGRYKIDGEVEGQFWHVIGMCRFETGELDDLLPEIRQLAPDAVF